MLPLVLSFSSSKFRLVLEIGTTEVSADLAIHLLHMEGLDILR